MTYPEMVTGSSKTGELHSKYKVLLIRKWSNRLPVNLHQNTYTMGGRRRITKILAKPYQNTEAMSIGQERHRTEIITM